MSTAREVAGAPTHGNRSMALAAAILQEYKGALGDGGAELHDLALLKTENALLRQEYLFATEELEHATAVLAAHFGDVPPLHASLRAQVLASP